MEYRDIDPDDDWMGTLADTLKAVYESDLPERIKRAVFVLIERELLDVELDLHVLENGKDARH